MIDHSKITPGYWYVKGNSDIETLDYSIVRVDEKRNVWQDACEYESPLTEFEFLGPVPDFKS